jgi:hypothetical protein
LRISRRIKKGGRAALMRQKSDLLSGYYVEIWDTLGHTGTHCPKCRPSVGACPSHKTAKNTVFISYRCVSPIYRFWDTLT